MNFKFLFNSNFTDSRLLQKMPNYEAEAQMFQEQQELERQKQLQQAQQQINQISQQGMAARGISTTNQEKQVVTNPVNKVANNAVTNPFTFNGQAVDFTYNKDLSARQNRKLLKKKLKSVGGDKADATGMIFEYWAQNGGASGSDKKWLDARASQYGYTTDANGNRDYHRTGNPVGRTFATIAGGLLMGPTGAYVANQLAKKKTPDGLVQGFYTPAPTDPAEKPVDGALTDPVEDPVVPTKPTSYTFSGFSGPWGSRIENVYNDNQQSEHWGKMDADQDGQITQDEFSAYQGQLGQTADGKLGRNSLAALGFGNQQNYSWMNPGGNGGKKYTPGSDEMWVDNSSAYGFKGTVNGGNGQGGGYVKTADWNSAKTAWWNDWQARIPNQKSVWDQKFGEGNYNVTYDQASNNYIANPINYGKVPSNISRYNTLYGEGNWNVGPDGKTIKYAQSKAPLRIENGKMYQGDKQVSGFRPKNFSPHHNYTINQNGEVLLNGVVYPSVRFNNGQMEQLNKNNWVAMDPSNFVYTYLKQGGLLKFAQGGTANSQKEQALLYATLGVIGQAASQGKQMQIEEAAAEVVSLAKSKPEALQELVSNTELINAGIQVVGEETVKQLSQPGVMEQLMSQVSNNPQINETRTAMNGTKLNYIKQLKGVCPEGYEMQYFAKGGHLCPVCKPKNIEEAKCGKKMKAKKHEEGGVSAAVNNVKEDMQKAKKDSTKTTFNDGRDKNLLKTSPKTYDKAKHQKLVNEFRKNGSSYKGWSKAKKDSLTRYNALLASDEDGDWSF